ADVTLAELKSAMKAVPRFRYIGSDEEKHHFLDRSRPRTVRIFRLDRTEWEPPKVLDLDDDLGYPVAFGDGKLIGLDPEKTEELDPAPGIGEAPLPAAPQDPPG